MGLDIGLTDLAKAAADKAHGIAWDEVYASGRWDKMTEGEKQEWRVANPSASNADVPSLSHPDHLFNRRYLRSSYNAGGFNRAVPEMVGADHDLYWIFEEVRGGSDEYEFELTSGSLAALAEAKRRALLVAEELRACSPLRVATADAMLGAADHLWHKPPTSDEALEWYREEAERHEKAKAAGQHTFDGGYSNAKGTVFGFDEGIEILAATTGGNLLGNPQAILIYRPKGDVKDHYVQSCEITAEFCDEAMMLIERDGSVSMHWSG